MSGPKVVIVRSPAELQREKEQRLRLFAAMSKEWQDCLELAGELSDDKVQSLEKRAKELSDAFSVGHDFGIEKIDRELSFLKAEIERLRSEAVHRLAKQRQRARSLENTARHLLKNQSGLSRDSRATMEHIIKNARNSSQSDLLSMDRDLSRVMNDLLKVKESAPDYKLDSEFVQNLSKDLSAPSQYTAPSVELPEKQNQIDLLIAEIQLLKDAPSLKLFTERAIQIEEVEDTARRQLLIDSLLIDLSRHCKDLKSRQEATRIFNKLKEELVNLPDSSCDQLKSKIELASESEDLKTAQLLEKELQECAKNAALRKDSFEKRKAILSGFAALGYEVKEGMATGWAQDGRIVISKKNHPELGIEIGSTDTVERVQMRAVAVSNANEIRDPGDDSQVETEWCSELSKIRKVLEESGHETRIETALPAGSTPLKVVKPKVWVDQETEESEQVLKKKQMRFL